MADFKKFTENFVSEVSNVANYIGEQAGKAYDYTKVKMTISGYETTIDSLYKKLGKYYFEKFSKGEPIDEACAEDCKMIEMYLKSIEALKNETKDE